LPTAAPVCEPTSRAMFDIFNPISNPTCECSRHGNLCGSARTLHSDDSGQSSPSVISHAESRRPSLSEPSSTVTLRRRAEAITWVRLQIARYGLTYADLAAAGAFPSRQRNQLKVRYRTADGQTWDGEGDMPDWLKRAVNAGQSAEHFRADT